MLEAEGKSKDILEKAKDLAYKFGEHSYLMQLLDKEKASLLASKEPSVDLGLDEEPSVGVGAAEEPAAAADGDFDLLGDLGGEADAAPADSEAASEDGGDFESLLDD